MDPMAIPEDFVVTGVPTRWTFTRSDVGTIWLWLRRPNGVEAVDFHPDDFETFAQAVAVMREAAHLPV